MCPARVVDVIDRGAGDSVRCSRSMWFSSKIHTGLGCPTARRGIRCDFRRCDRRQSPPAVRSQTGRSMPRSALASTDTATCSDCGPAPAVRAPISSMSVLTDIRHRGTRDVFFLVCDGLKGLPDEASQHESQSTQVRPTPTPVAPERELADLDTTKFHTHWSPEVDHQLMNSRTIPQHSSRPEGPRL